jgi:hypothetical protein
LESQKTEPLNGREPEFSEEDRVGQAHAHFRRIRNIFFASEGEGVVTTILKGTTTMGQSRGDLVLEYWDVTKLIPYARNARTHSAAQVAEIAVSIRSFGFSNPILVSEAGDVIAGHGRLAAAQRLGMQTVPVIVLNGLSEIERRQLVLADNRIAANAGWDMEMLKLELNLRRRS